MLPEERFEQNQGIVYSIYHKCFESKPSNKSIKEDIIQEGLIGLWRACNKFDETMDVRFSIYAHIGVYQRMLNVAKKHFKTSKDLVSLNMPFYQTSGDDEIVSYEDMICDNANPAEEVEIQELVLQVLSTSSDQARCIINYRLTGYTQYEIAEILNLTQSYISRVLKKFKKQLKETMEEDND